MKINRRLRLICVILFVMTFPCACEKEPDATSEVERSGVFPVLVEQASKGHFRVERRFTGEVRAEVELKAVIREPGKVAVVSIPKDGEPVKAGRILLRLRSEELDLELQEGEGDFQAAKLILDRNRELHEKGLVPLSNLEDKRREFERARVRLEQLKLRNKNLTLKAAASGIAARASIPGVGQYCEKGLEVLRILEPESLRVEVAVPAGWKEDVTEIKTAVIELPGGGETEAGPVSFSAEVDAARGGRILKLRPTHPESLVQGDVLAVRLVLASRDEAVTVPLEALVETSDGGWEVHAGPAAGSKGRIKAINVVRGPDDGRRVIIESGLEPDTWIVVGSARNYVTWVNYLGVAR